MIYGSRAYLKLGYRIINFNTMNYSRYLLTSALILAANISNAELVANFNMEVNSGKITETVSGSQFSVDGHFAPENVKGVVGNALRFDGYTSKIEAGLGAIIPANSKYMTVSMWVALPCYPIIQIDTDTSEKTAIATCLDSQNKSGFGFYVGFDGKYSFRTFIGGWPLSIDVDTPLPTYQWNNLVAVIDCDNRSAKLYNNGIEVGSKRASGSISISPSVFYMGQATESRMSGPFELMSFNGLIDDISIWNEAKSADEIQSWTTTEIPDLNIPESRFAEDLLRPRFHGMPAAGWTNECHGMYYSDGRYHLFFQKNADGPYMARLHWGHISSENLYDWKEEKIALAPGESYDIKGCWSGSVFSDEIITGGKPNILYTAVDYVKATIAQASPESDALVNWIKNPGNPIIGGKPSGLSDDFRDPYFFRNGDNAYIIVGSSKNGIGTTTLHRYNATSGLWSNNGDLFFTGSNASNDGVFWEMPNVTLMPDNRWLFTATPLGTSQGVRTLYWTGSIDNDGKFIPDSKSGSGRLVEMNYKEGFGLLSPTIYQHDDKTIVLGIVPDKLSAQSNWNLGWAHCYSLPREWSLDPDGNLIQKPFEGLVGMRTSNSYSQNNFDLDGTIGLAPVSGRSVELSGSFEIGSADFGFNFFKSGSSQATVTYSPATGNLTVDFSKLTRLTNDNNVYDGVYICPLPERPAKGSTLKINIFIDHSILDIFINDKWASSIRVFPTEADANGIEVFSNSATKVHNLSAWILDASANNSGIDSIWADNTAQNNSKVDVYNLMGVKIRSSIDKDIATANLPAGIYIVNGEKVIVR